MGAGIPDDQNLWAEIGDVAVGNTIMEGVRKAVARIYYLLRNICGFIMLGGLIFTGIRILTSTNIPSKKSQYLYYLQDWIIRYGIVGFFARADDRDIQN